MIDFLPDVESSLAVLKSGGIILYPTDTVWGLGCDATNAAAVEKIYALKHRPSSKSMIVLVADERDILQYVAAPDMQVFQYLETTGKPTTVVYDNVIGLAENLLAEDGSLGIRITADPFCRQLIKRMRKPLVSTSANTSGQATPAFFAQVTGEIRAGVDYVVSYRQEDNTPATASSVIRWKNGVVEIIRP